MKPYPKPEPQTVGRTGAERAAYRLRALDVLRGAPKQPDRWSRQTVRSAGRRKAKAELRARKTAGAMSKGGMAVVK